ncbi:MAG: 3-hydroxyisobutyrate dehydrogenase [Paracoccaceae bacterium]|jgi:3-hydroxyisobutyrate dehydrogenase
MKIGIIGLGNMGAPMAKNLAEASYEVIGFDIILACPEGIASALSAVSIAKSCDVVITMLPNGEIVQSVSEEIIPEMLDGSTLLDCSTIDVETAVKVANLASKYGVLAADAPVSGGVGGAVSGSLTFMVGGSETAFNKVAPLLEIMGQKSVHCGPSGSGQSAKICNNMILGATMIATCEAFVLADKLNLDRQKMFDVVSTSSGYSWSMNTYCPAPGIGPISPADNNYKPGFSSDLMLKDLRLSQLAAKSVNADTPMGRLAEELFRSYVEDEDGSGKDFSSMIERFSRRDHP